MLLDGYFFATGDCLVFFLFLYETLLFGSYFRKEKCT